MRYVRMSLATAVALGSFVVFGRIVRTGSIAEAKYGADSAVTIADEGIGDKILMFVGPWTAEKIRAVGDCCRVRGLRFSMDEMFDRLTGDWKDEYRPIRGEVLKAIGEYRDVFDGTQHQSESGGVLFYWPLTSEPFVRAPVAKDSYSAAFDAVGRQLKKDIDDAKAGGLVPPYFTIECGAFGVAPYLLRAGWDRVDLEVIYTDELERQYAGAKTAAEVYGRESFGTDMAMAWYGGMQDDGLREHRWRTSLYHAYLRGADPIYNEHGLMDLVNHGYDLGRNDPMVVRYRRVLSDFAKWAKTHPRADGYPRAAVGAIYGRCDGYAGVFQTHLFGQRTNELFRVSEADTAWRMFDGLYRRRAWQDRDRWGEADCSGNPPLGAAGVLPFDAADAEFAKYRFLFFLGRNVMDDALYAKLVRYVQGGGTLMLAASHLDCQDVPKGPFRPYNGGDWSELVGVKVGAGKTTHLPYGLKFVRNPDEGWNFQPLTKLWDPDFTDGGFDIPDLAATTAEPFAVSSTQFVERDLAALKPVLYVNRVGKGKVIFLASVDSPGAPGVRRLYEFLLAKAMEAEGRDVWPKVECTDSVRWSVYADGTVYLLNTEKNLVQEAVVKRTANGFAEKILLQPGEFRTVEGTKFPLTDLHRELPSVKAYRERLSASPPCPRGTNCTVTVERAGGVPRIVVDGQALAGTCIVPDPRVPVAETEFSIRDFSASGLRVAGNFLESKGVLPFLEWWLDEGVYDFARLDAAFAAAIRGMPEGWVFPRLSIDPPKAWIDRHPGEMRANEVRPDSAAWRKLYRRMLEDVITHVETSPYAAHVMGYQIGALHAGEWLIYPWPDGEIPAEAQDPRDPLPPLDGNPLRRAYTRKCSGDIASALLDAAQTVRRLTGGKKLVGAFFGYLHTNGQQDMARVIASPHVDFFASPTSYKFRGPGQAAPLQASLTASFGLHGKVFYEEADIRTLYARTDEPYRMKDLFQSVNAIRRSVGFSLANGTEAWWFLLTGNDSFHDERLMDAVRIGCEEKRRTLANVPCKRPDVGVFFAPDDYSSCSQSPCEPLCRDLRYHLFRTILPFCGVGFDSYLLSDIAHPDLPDYKVYVFPNAFDLTEAQRAAVKRVVRRKGRSAVWIMAPGYYRNGAGNAANVSDLTGIEIAERYPVAEGRYSRTFAVTDPAGATKELDGWRSVYLPKSPDREELVAALKTAGAHFWTDPGDVVSAGRGYLMVCAAKEGLKRIVLPARCDVAEVYGASPARRNVFSFEEPFRFGEVRVYRLEDKPSESTTAVAVETAALQEAIDAAAEKGGGRVVVPPGRHVTGQLHLRSNVELHLEKGAVLEGAVGMEHYRLKELPYSEGVWSAVVFAIGVTNVAITGEGEICGNGTAWPQPGGYAGNQEGLRPRGVFFADSKDIRLEDFRFRDGACWGIVLKCCDGVKISGLTIDTHANANNDGIDIEARNVVITGCDIDSSDDSIVLKSNDPHFTVENVFVSNCTVRSACCALKLGTASHGTMRDIVFVDCRAESPRRDFPDRRPGKTGYGWFTHPRRRMCQLGKDWQVRAATGCLCVECVDGGTIENVSFRNIVANGSCAPIFVRGGTRSGRDCGTPPSDRHILRNISFENITGESLSWVASSVTGVDGCRVENVSLKNVSIVCKGAGESWKKWRDTPVPEVAGEYPDAHMFGHILPAYGLYARHVDGLTMENCFFRLKDGTTDSRPAVVRDDVK